MVKQKVYCGHDIPVADCTEHWPLMCDVTGYTIERRAIEWALGSDTGTSSNTLCAFMLGVKRDDYSMPPFDKHDRGRCIRLLRLIPEWLPRLPDLAEANPGGMGGEPDEVNNANWSEQIKLILQEGGF